MSVVSQDIDLASPDITYTNMNQVANQAQFESVDSQKLSNFVKIDPENPHSIMNVKTPKTMTNDDHQLSTNVPAYAHMNHGEKRPLTLILSNHTN